MLQKEQNKAREMKRQVEDKKIANQIKQKKKEKNRKSVEDDEFDELLSKYKAKVLKRVKTSEEQGQEFQEAEYS